MFGKKKEKSPEPSFQRDAEYTQSPEESERVINVENRPEKRATSAILSSDAEIEGTINFDGIMRIDGKIIASDKVVLKQKAHLIGDLQAKHLVIEEGVVFVGRCNVNPKGVKSDNFAKKGEPKTNKSHQ